MSDLWTEKYKFIHRLQGVTQGIGEEIARTMEGALEKVTARIVALEAKADDSKSYVYKKRYLDKQKAEIEKVLDQVYADIGGTITEKAIETGLAMPSMVDAMVKSAGITVELGVPKLTKKQVTAWFEASQVEGLYFNEWLKKLEGNAVARIIQETREAKVLSESLRQTAKRLQNALDIGRRSAEGLAHNALHTMANWAERQYWMENRDKITALRYVAEIDRQTCPLCIPLDQQVFKVDECPQPPLHHLCRCFTMPVFKWDDANERLGTRPARIDTDARTVKHRDGTTSTKYESLRVQHISTGMTHSQWMQSMVNSSDPRDQAFAREALGPTRYSLCQSGKLTVDRLYYGGKLRTIKELEALTK